MKKIESINDHYLAKWLNAELSDEELKKLISDNDFNAFKKIKEGLDKFESPAFNSEKLFSNIKSKNKKNKVRKLIINLSYAVAAILVVAFGLYLYSYSNVAIKSNFGQQLTAQLLDGSTATLNSKSKISYNKKRWNKKRLLFLHGEAYFKVKKGSKFEVITTNGEVSVLGTHFNVNSTKDYFEVTCYEGKVWVTYKKTGAILNPGESVQIANGKVKTYKTTLKNPSWLNGENSFKSSPLTEVILKLENQYNIKIDSKNINKKILFTGSFSNNNINLALKSICIPLNLNYKIIGPKEVVLSNK